MIRTYIDWVLDVPWSKTTEDRLDLVAARAVLDQDHYDLDKVKDRIIEYLAVQKLKNEQHRDHGARGEDPNAVGAVSSASNARPVAIKGPILCFVGAPGVGKTSLGQSIARAIDWPSEVLPTPGGPTKQRIGPLIRPGAAAFFAFSF